MVKNKLSGFTIIELMITLTLVGILSSIAAPSFTEMIEQNRIKQAAEGLKADLQWVRSESIKQSCNINSVFTTGTNWNYVITPCTSAAKTVNSTSSSVSMSASTFATNTVTFDFRRGEAQDGDVTFSTINYELSVKIEDGYQIGICNPDGAKKVSGYESC